MTTTQAFSKKKTQHVFKKSTLAVCMAALTAQAYGQQTASPEPTALEEVVIYGVRQSLINAQDIRRDAATVKDVITASDIGALPDKSIVEALQRVPGVAIERFEASDDPDHFSVEGGGVTVRGLNRVRAEFNGRDGFSAGRDGGLNFSDIPPEMVGSVEVSKNQTADMVEGGIAGTINLITRKPFDSDDLVIGATVRASYGDLIDEVTPAFSGIASNVWETDVGKFGALISLSASEFTSRGDGVGIYNYYPLADMPAGGQAGQEYWAPAAGSVRQQENDRSRFGFSTALQWADPSETIQATLEFIHSTSELSWTERFLEYGDQPFTPDARGVSIQDGATFNCPSGSSITGVPCMFTSGVINEGGNAAGFEGAPFYQAGTRIRNDKRVINDVSLNLQYTPTDNLTITGDLQYTEATSEIDDISVHGKVYSDVFLDLRHRDNARIEFLNDDVANPESYFMRSAMDHIGDNEGDQFAISLDGEYTFDSGWITGVKAGFRASNKTLDVRETNYNWGSLNETWMGDMPPTYDQLDGIGAVEQFTFHDHLKGNALQGNNTFWFPSLDFVSDISSMYATMQEHILGGDPTWTPLHLRSSAMEDSPFRPSDLSTVEEDRSSVYLRADFGDEDGALRYSGNVGLRYVNWQSTSTGANTFGAYDEVFGEATGDFLNYHSWTMYGNDDNPDSPFYLPEGEPQRAKNDELRGEVEAYLDQDEGEAYTIEGDKFSRVLPSFNIKVELTEDLLVRFAASETIYMPDLHAIRNRRTVTPTLSVERDIREVDGELSEGIVDVDLLGYAASGSGNPYLQPELSTNFDLAFEWYFADFGSFTSTFFHKRVRDYFRQSSVLEQLTNSAGITNDVVVTNTQNAGTATIKGYELAYQSDFSFVNEALVDFGIQTSYTFINGSSTNGGDAQHGGDPESKHSLAYTYNNFQQLPLEGLSRDNYNVVLFYDNGTFQSRFAYNWRSSYLLSSRDAIAFAPVFGESTGQLDASMSWQVNDNLRVGLEANNLLNEVTRTSILNETTSADSRDYNQQGVRSPRSYFANDRRFALFLQATY